MRIQIVLSMLFTWNVKKWYFAPARGQRVAGGHNRCFLHDLQMQGVEGTKKWDAEKIVTQKCMFSRHLLLEITKTYSSETATRTRMMAPSNGTCTSPGSNEQEWITTFSWSQFTRIYNKLSTFITYRQYLPILGWLKIQNQVVARSKLLDRSEILLMNSFIGMSSNEPPSAPSALPLAFYAEASLLKPSTSGASVYSNSVQPSGCSSLDLDRRHTSTGSKAKSRRGSWQRSVCIIAPWLHLCRIIVRILELIYHFPTTIIDYEWWMCDPACDGDSITPCGACQYGVGSNLQKHLQCRTNTKLETHSKWCCFWGLPSDRTLGLFSFSSLSSAFDEATRLCWFLVTPRFYQWISSNLIQVTK